jgi:hypothetical protein
MYETVWTNQIRPHSAFSAKNVKKYTSHMLIPILEGFNVRPSQTCQIQCNPIAKMQLVTNIYTVCASRPSTSNSESNALSR